jgi:leader peptidase (prepilin peptidase)/N-methyltransferase
MTPAGLGVGAFAVGAVVGSFANVVIHRLPREESIVTPGSHCPHCNTPIRWYDNIPLVSFALLRGRCRRCTTAISLRYPVIEALAGVLFVQAVLAFGPGLAAARTVVLETLLLIVCVIDLDHRIIPDRITKPGILLGLLFMLPFGWARVAAAVLTSVGMWGVFVLVNRASLATIGVEGMGGGDAKLAAMIGAFLGWPIGVVAIFLGIFVGGLLGAALVVARIKGRRDYVPFGPMLAGGAFLALWWGPGLLAWYGSRIVG